MKIIKITCFLLVLQALLYSQSGWFYQNSGTQNTLTSVCFVNPETGYICGLFGTFLKTTNGGVNWSRRIIDSTSLYMSVYFFNTSTGYMISQSKFLKTTNGGVNWNSLFTYGFGLGKLFFINMDIGFLTSREYILKTINGGLNWQLIRVEYDVQFNDIFFTNELTGYLVGISNNVYKTTNQGLNWIPYFLSTSFATNSVFFTSVNTGYAAGDDGNVFKTVNGGLNWEALTVNTNYRLYSIKFINESTGFICGSNIILKTVNRGITWTFNLFDTNNYSPFYNINFVNENTGFVVGEKEYGVVSGLILKTTNGGNTIGIKPISTEIPRNFSLSQNYPNPFNPASKIKFDIPKLSFTVIKIFNILGEEISVLANETLKPGAYEIEWDASNYPSGTYFYRLQSGGYMETKKMVLLK